MEKNQKHGRSDIKVSYASFKAMLCKGALSYATSASNSLNKSIRFRAMSAEKQQLDEQCAGIEISDYIRAKVLEHFVPRSRTRDWFGITINRFQERSTTTPMGATRYATVGRLVPITTVMMEVPGVGWQQL